MTDFCGNSSMKGCERTSRRGTLRARLRRRKPRIRGESRVSRLYRRLHSCINRAPPHAVGGAISSRARPLASGPIWVTATAAITTITAIATNTAVRPKLCWIHRKDGIATKAPTRPADWQSPKPEARALVGNNSEVIKFAPDSPPEGDGFELSVPRERGDRFELSLLFMSLKPSAF